MSGYTGNRFLRRRPRADTFCELTTITPESLSLSARVCDLNFGSLLNADFVACSRC